MAGHTPGPWVEKFGDVYAPSGQVVPHWGDSWEAPDRFVPEAERDANARLIAAAPELLEAAKLALAEAEAWAHDQLDGTSGFNAAMAILNPVREAIAKATQP